MSAASRFRQRVAGRPAGRPQLPAAYRRPVHVHGRRLLLRHRAALARAFDARRPGPARHRTRLLRRAAHRGHPARRRAGRQGRAARASCSLPTWSAACSSRCSPSLPPGTSPRWRRSGRSRRCSAPGRDSSSRPRSPSCRALLGPDRLQAGNALNSAAIQFGSLLGPALGGILVATAGLGACLRGRRSVIRGISSGPGADRAQGKGRPQCYRGWDGRAWPQRGR